MKPLKILAIEPFYGGSHRAFLEGLASNSVHHFDMLTRPASNWKWTMRASALELARQLNESNDSYDLIFASDFLDLASFKGLMPRRLIDTPVITYFHENQLTYPVQSKMERDSHFGFTNITTLHACQKAWFNSCFHLNAFRAAVEEFLKQTPAQAVPEWLEPFATKASVVSLGLNLQEWDQVATNRNGPLTILWNHRWEFDKNPESFRDALEKLAQHTKDFRLIICGQQFNRWPTAFDEIKAAHSDQTIHFGEALERRQYMRLVKKSDVVISTANHEFFGLSMIEAAYAGCYPLVPRRLSYPEIIPEELHSEHLYSSDSDLADMLCKLADDPHRARHAPLSKSLARYDWSSRIEEFDRLLADEV